MQITGYRAWAIVEDEQGYALASPVQGTVWPERMLEAVCQHGDIATCPGQCGIRLWLHRESAQYEAKHARASVIGTANAYGYVSTYEKAHLASICIIEDLDFSTLSGIDQDTQESVVADLTRRYLTQKD